MSDYDTDILTWSEHQAALLHRIARGERLNEAPTGPTSPRRSRAWGESEVRAVEVLLAMALLHMLKAEAWPLLPDRSGGGPRRVFSGRQARRKFRPSMRQKIDLAGLYSDALAGLPDDMDGQLPLPLPDRCPVTLDELLAE